MVGLYKFELERLMEGLAMLDIPFEFQEIFDGGQVCVPSIEKPEWDAVCHTFSYGSAMGLLEISGTTMVGTDDAVEGWLTVDEILDRVSSKGGLHDGKS